MNEFYTVNKNRYETNDDDHNSFFPVLIIKIKHLSLFSSEPFEFSLKTTT